MLDERTRKELRKQLLPLTTELAKILIDALALRIEWHLMIAKQHGAEDEDIPKIISGAMDSASKITMKAINELSERDNAAEWTRKIIGH